VQLLHYRIMAQPVAPAPGGGLRVRNLTVERVQREHWLTRQFPRSEEILDRRFGRGAVCFAAHVRGELVGHLWLQEIPFDDRDAGCLFVPMPPGRAVWDYDIWIAPAWRMSRAFTALWDAANAWMRSRNVQWTLSCVVGGNASSLAAHRRLGSQALAQLWAVRLGPLQLAVFTQRPYAAVARLDRGRPRIEVRAPVRADDQG
jgi:hypothetical protein